jgi:hypothetical protein
LFLSIRGCGPGLQDLFRGAAENELEVKEGMRNSSHGRGLLLVALLALAVFAGSSAASALRQVPPPENPGTDARPPAVWMLHNLGNMWSAVLNVGLFGDPWAVYPSVEWPAASGNSYLWEGELWTCCYGPVTVWGDSTAKWASLGDYAIGWELRPSEGYPAQKLSPGPVALEETQYGYDDWNSAYNTDPYGLFVLEKNYTWGTPGYSDFLANDFLILHDSDQGNPGVPLGALVLGIKGDCDIASGDVTECNLDDLVYYDGHAIWCNDPDASFDYTFDDGTPASTADIYTYQQNPDAVYADSANNIFYYYNYIGSDGLVDADVDGNGVSDHFTILAKVAGADTIYATEPNTGMILFADGMPPNYFEHIVGDTTYLVVPRNTTYMWDSDATASSKDDSGEPDNIPVCNGFIGWRLLDLWVKKADGTIERPCDVMGVPVPLAHSWWNWESDPGGDTEKTDMMWGENPDLSGRTSGPAFLVDWVGNPFAPSAFAPENPGPWPIVDDNPLAQGYPVFDYRFLLGMGPVNLADGDSLHIMGGWVMGLGLDGLRQSSDVMLDAYYRGGGWGVPKLPPTPILFYEAQDQNVHLEWGANAETYTPFGGYRIYRATFEPNSWQLIADIPVGTYTYDDNTVVNGFPYYYVVCAYDADTGVESTKSNYKQTIQGTPISVVPSWNATDDWKNQVAVVPNPYRGSAEWEQTYFDKIAFINLPVMCDIYIYTLGGDHVITLEHRGWAGDEGTEYWDLSSRNDQEIVSGLYLYRIETENDFLIGKFAVIK